VSGPALAQRELALAAVALLACVVALAVASTRAGDSEAGSLPRSIPAPGGGWNTGLAGSGGKTFKPGRTECGYLVTPETPGVAHSVLPCDVKLFISYNGREVLTQVIGRGPYVPGRQFQLTKALGDLLGLQGTQEIRWRYAG